MHHLPRWIESIPSPTAEEIEPVAEIIDREAAGFPEPARFRAACSRVLATAQQEALTDIARHTAGLSLERLASALTKFKGPPALILDTVRIATGTHRNAGFSIAKVARVHGIAKQSLHERVLRMAAFLGVVYKREKPYKVKHSPPQLP